MDAFKSLYPISSGLGENFFNDVYAIDGNLLVVFDELISHLVFLGQDLSSDIVKASSTLDHLNLIITSYRQGHVSCPNVSVKDIDSLEQMKLDLTCLHQKWQTIFMWQDGPLVQAMKSGDLFLVDEISLADDSVLERLNSVLEPERKLVGIPFIRGLTFSFYACFCTRRLTQRAIGCFPTVGKSVLHYSSSIILICYFCSWF